MAALGKAALVVHPQVHRRRSATVLGDQQTDLREVEDLTTFRADHLGIGEIPSTVPAGAGHMGDHGVGIDHLGQMPSRGTGLLTLLALGGPTFGP